MSTSNASDELATRATRQPAQASRQRGEFMLRTCTSILAFASAAVGSAAAPKVGLDTGKIEELTGAKGKLDEKEGTFKVSVPRADLSVTVSGSVKLTPP